MVINHGHFYRSQYRTRFFLPVHGASYIIILLISVTLYFEMLHCKSQPDNIEGNFYLNRGARHKILSSWKKTVKLGNWFVFETGYLYIC